MEIVNSSYANASETTTLTADVHFSFDFSSKTITTTSTQTFKALKDNVSQIILDSKGLNIPQIQGPGTFSLGDTHPVIGTAVIIALNSALSKDETVAFTIQSTTNTDQCTAVQWLEPSMTAGKQHPYCYTQCEAIHCRTLLPIQDTPSVKIVFKYTLDVPEPLQGIAAAVADRQESNGGRTVFYSHLDIPIPAYLVAFAVGDIAFQKISERCGIYAEPSMLQESVFEFGEMEQFLTTGETFLPAYAWGPYNLLILPPSYNYGGMENPTLTFVTPTTIAGDRSLVDVVAHEIAHSWTGNLVTNLSWEHFWLNEGCNVYVERKILERLEGSGKAGLKSENGWNSLQNTIDQLGADHNFTRLNLELGAEDPDDAFSNVPYEKGFFLLKYLEQLVGEGEFLAFFKDWIEENSLKTVTSQQFQERFSARFQVQVDWDTWLKGTGMPPVKPQLDTSLIEQVQRSFEEIKLESHQVSAQDIADWNVDQKTLLLQLALLDPQPHFLQWGEPYQFDTTKNYEIKNLWVQLFLQLHDDSRLQQARDILLSQGRMKFVRPIFRSLVSNGYREVAAEVFGQIRNFYHPVLVSLLQKEFGFQYQFSF